MVWGLERERLCVCVCVRGVQRLGLRNDGMMWQVPGVLAFSLHLILPGERPGESRKEDSRISRFTSVPFLPKSGWVGSRVGLAAGEAAPCPAPALAPNNAASPSPSPLSGGLLGSRR